LVAAVVDGLDARSVALTPWDQLADLAPAGTLELPASAQRSSRRKSGAESSSDSSTEKAKVVARQRALQLAGSAYIPQLVTFVGFLGATLRRDPTADKFWVVLYVDPQLSSWLLVPTEGVVWRDRVTDEHTPWKDRDVIWVTADSSVGVGSGSQSVQAQFLTGEFTRAADFDASPGGGTIAAATGVFCEGRSPGCCKPKTPKG
jgi:hypothetical protein